MIVILGGTAEARELADGLDRTGRTFLTTLAGRVARPRLPFGPVRLGGFGGVSGLTRFLVENEVTCLVDATHPFAAAISANALEAAGRVGVPLLRLERPGWAQAPGAENWIWVHSHAEAAAAAVGFDRPLLTTGRQTIGEFTGSLHAHPVVVRVVDPPSGPLPDRWTLISDRGPYRLAGELALFETHDIDVLVTKDSGGAYTWPKMKAAEELGAEVVIVRRPVGTAGTDVVSTVAEALEWLDARAGGSSVA